MSFKTLQTSFNALNICYKALESSFEVRFGRKVAKEDDPSWVWRESHWLGFFFSLSHLDLVWLFSLLFFVFFLN
jgi:hypothetical protein